MNEIETLPEIVRAIERLSDLLERRVLPRLELIASALGRAPTSLGVGEPNQVDAIVVARETIAAGDWARARVLIEMLENDAPDRAALLVEELVSARESACDRLRAQIQAARDADDPERALALRDELQAILGVSPDRELDQTLARWIMSLIQRRLIHPPIGSEVPHLAALAAERFPDTKEGASLRKALPTLRRSAGLCPRCAGPFVGVEDACPACLAKLPNLTVASLAPPVAGPEPEGA